MFFRNTSYRKYIFVLLILLSVSSYLNAQSGATYRKNAVLNGNNISFPFTNSGIIGQPGNIGPLGCTWKGINNGYIGDLSIVIGVEFPVKDYTGDGIPDTLHEVVITPVSRPGGGSIGPGGEAWGFEPVNGFFNSTLSSVAISNNPATWPFVWPDHPEWGSGVWNGFLGPNNFVGSQEAYFQMDDQHDRKMYTMYGILPDSAHPEINGNGLRINVRYVQLSQSPYDNMLFQIYDIKNESKYTYSKMYLGQLTGTYIGGMGDEYNDDASYYYPTDKMIYSWDYEPGLGGKEYIRPSANPYWQGKPGGFSPYIISSGGGIGSFDYFVPAGAITMSDNNNMWERSKEGNFIHDSTFPLYGEDGDYIFATKYFSLVSGETKRIATLLNFGYDRTEVFMRNKLGEALYNSNFDTVAVKQNITLTSLPYHKIISGNELIKWSAQNTMGTVEIWFTPDMNKTWVKVSADAPNTGSYLFNSTSVADCSFGYFCFFIKNTEGAIYGYNFSNPLSINNKQTGTPFIKLLTDNIYSGTITDDNYDFNFLIGESKNQNLTLNVYYQTANDTNYYLSESFPVNPDTIPQTHLINLKLTPNSDNLSLKFEVSNNANVWSDITDPFSKQNQRNIISQGNLENLSTYANVPLSIRVIDSTKFTGHDYLITFNDTDLITQKKYSVFDKTTGTFRLKDRIFLPKADNIFDGLAVYADDYTTHLDTAMWNFNRINNLRVFMDVFGKGSQYSGYSYPFDYRIVFSNTYNDSSNYLNNIFGDGAPPANTHINFKVYQVKKNVISRNKFVFSESGTFRRDTLSNLDQLSLTNENADRMSWKLVTLGDSLSYVPKGGDTLFILTKKGLSIYDTIRVFNLPTDVKELVFVPGEFKLEQNYPNPFNPSTTIRFSIPERLKVTLKVYDILGRELTTLVNQVMEKGSYAREFSSTNMRGGLASGVYIYRIEAGKYVSARKLMLIK